MKNLFKITVIVTLFISLALVLPSCTSCKKETTSPVVITSSISTITSTTATSGGNVTDDGGAEVTVRGVCWNTSENPTTSNDMTSDGAGTGTFTSNLTQLSPATKYYVRAYATNEACTAYGTSQSFTTLSSLTYGLVAYYPFNGNANDESGNGNNGTVNEATLTTDRSGNPNRAYSFDGVNDYIEINNSSSLNLTNALSISCWTVKISSSSASSVISKDIPATDQGYRFDFLNEKGRFVKQGNTFDMTNLVYSQNIWYHTVILIDGANLKYYINGILDKSYVSTLPVRTTSLPLLIGSDAEMNPSRFFNGKIDDIRIYNRPLTEADIQLLYNEL